MTIGRINPEQFQHVRGCQIEDAFDLDVVRTERSWTDANVLLVLGDRGR
jgi:hypothetical protein